MRRILVITLTALTLLAGRPTYAAATEDYIAGGATYQQVVREAHSMLAPMALQRGQSFTLSLDGSSAVAADLAEHTRERVINLMANAMASAPSGSRIQVRFNPQTYQLVVTVRNHGEALSTSRDVVDPLGHTFHLTTTAGEGAELEASLLHAPLTLDQ